MGTGELLSSSLSVTERLGVAESAAMQARNESSSSRRSIVVEFIAAEAGEPDKASIALAMPLSAPVKLRACARIALRDIPRRVAESADDDTGLVGVDGALPAAVPAPEAESDDDDVSAV